MIPERMLEFLCLQEIIGKFVRKGELGKFVCGETNYVHIGSRTINYEEMWSRRNQILTELIEPYVIDSTSKER